MSADVIEKARQSIETAESQSAQPTNAIIKSAKMSAVSDLAQAAKAQKAPSLLDKLGGPPASSSGADLKQTANNGIDNSVPPKANKVQAEPVLVGISVFESIGTKTLMKRLLQNGNRGLILGERHDLMPQKQSDIHVGIANEIIPALTEAAKGRNLYFFYEVPESYQPKVDAIINAKNEREAQRLYSETFGGTSMDSVEQKAIFLRLRQRGFRVICHDVEDKNRALSENEVRRALAKERSTGIANISNEDVQERFQAEFKAYMQDRFMDGNQLAARRINSILASDTNSFALVYVGLGHVDALLPAYRGIKELTGLPSAIMRRGEDLVGEAEVQRLSKMSGVDFLIRLRDSEMINILSNALQSVKQDRESGNLQALIEKGTKVANAYDGNQKEVEPKNYAPGMIYGLLLDAAKQSSRQVKLEKIREARVYLEGVTKENQFLKKNARIIALDAYLKAAESLASK